MRNHIYNEFTVKTCYKTLEEGPYIESPLSWIWKIKGPPRVLIFLWLMLQNIILTVDNLMRRGWVMVNRCCLCKQAMESVKHLFGQCQYTDQVRRQLCTCMPHIVYTDQFRRGEYKKVILSRENIVLTSLQLVLLFVVWRERCNRTFTDKHSAPEALAVEIRLEFRSWFQVH